MKFSQLLFWMLTGACLLLTAPACKQDACKDLDCGLNGECIDGICDCDPGYLVDDFGRCEVRQAELIAGIYHATTTGCDIDDYILTIQANPTQGNGIFIVNLGEYTCNNTGGELSIRANFVSESQFEIDAEENYCDQYSIIGSGTIEADSSIRVVYRAEYEIGGGSQLIENCTVVLSK